MTLFYLLFCFFRIVVSYEFINLTRLELYTDGTNDMCTRSLTYPMIEALDNTYYINITTNDHKVIQYSNFIEPLSPSYIDPATGNLVLPERIYPQPIPFDGKEGLYYEQNQCRLCPYYNLRQPSQCDFPRFRICHEPLDGYCLSNYPSQRLACHQNQFFYPVSWFGEFYYPRQYPAHIDGIPDIVGQERFSLHDMYQQDMENDYNMLSRVFFPHLTPITHFYKYGMTRRNNIFHRNTKISTQGVNPHDDSNQIELVLQLRKGFSIEGHTWGLWLQTFCDGKCHRDSLYTIKKIILEDVQNNTILSYLEAMYHLGSAFQYWDVCLKCLNDTEMVWRTFDSPVPHPYWLMAASNDCRPWFGAVPILNTAFHNFPIITNNVKIATNGKFPAVGIEGGRFQIQDTLPVIHSTLCPVDTYNRICDLTKAQRARDVYRLSGIFSQPNCTVCPAGFSTYGLKGLWYCLPPRGRILIHRTLFNKFMNTDTNISKVWARRDVIKEEFECGTKPSECIQCNRSGETVGLTPDEFNEKIIFEPLLQDQLCPSNYYCPHPLQESIMCPNNMCSRPGSFDISNCTCCPGKYWNASSSTCVSCTPRNSCPSGQYLKGSVECETTVGPKNPQQCIDCAIIPGSDRFLSFGIEIGNLASGFSHFCPFECQLGRVLNYPPAQHQFSSCARTYSCLNATLQLGPYSLPSASGFAYITNPIAEIPRDSVSYEESSGLCTSYTLFSYFFSIWNQQSGLSSNVLNACPCQGACRVTQNATLFQNYNCSPCSPVNPPHSTYTDGALLGLVSQQNLHCTWKCDSGFYSNQTSCFNCTEKALQVCPVGFSLRGNGCSGDMSYVANFTIANCFNCSQNLGKLSPTQYLDLTTCSIQNCSLVTLSSNHYFSEKCGGGTSSITTQSQCSTCLGTQYQARPCAFNDTLDRLCLSCTTFKPGYYLVSNCTAFSDSVWEICPPNFYCTGDGSQAKCPQFTESRPSSTSILNCYCKFGLQMSGDICIRKVCPGTTLNIDLPSLTEDPMSPYFLSWNSLTSTTECKPCSEVRTDIFARGTMKNMNSCTCPVNFFIPQVQTNMSCSNCINQAMDVSCAGSTTFYRNPTTCSPSGISRTCQCILPPHAFQPELFCPASSNVISCKDNFVRTQSPDNLLPSTLENSVTGSNVYVSSLNWSRAFHFDNRAVDKLRTTSNWNISHYSNDNMQYVFWTVPSLSNRSIYVQRVYSEEMSRMRSCFLRDSQQCSPYIGEEANWWQTICASDQSQVIVNFFVFPWTTSMHSSLFFEGKQWVGSTHIAALLYNQNSKTYLASFVAMDVKSDANAYFRYQTLASCEGSTPSVVLPIGTNDKIIDVAGTLEAPGFRNVDHSFYVGYNAANSSHSIILGVFRNISSSAVVQYSLTFTQFEMLGFCIYSTTGSSINVYVIPNSSDISIIRMYRWNEFQSVSVTSTEEGLFLVPSFKAFTKVHTFSAVWSRDLFEINFVLVADVYESADDVDHSTKIFTADFYQKTFVPVQNMPPRSSPKYVALYETLPNTAILWASGLNGLYSIQVKKCTLASASAVPQYYDGRQCRNHHCVRRPPCSSQNNREFNPLSNTCVCKPGYYELSGLCYVCPENSYCMNGIRNLCSPSFLVSQQGSMYIQNCTCPNDAMYFNTQECTYCPKGSYCPDKWNRHICPGNVDVQLSTSTSMYPIGCVCSAGSEGAGCTICPPGYVCPDKPKKQVQNVAVRLEVREKPNNVSSAFIETLVCSTIMPMIQSYFIDAAPNSFFYMHKTETLLQRYYCVYHRSLDLLRHESYFIIMIQVDETENTVVSGLFNTYQRIADLNNISTPSGAGNYVTYLHTIPRPTTLISLPPMSAQQAIIKGACRTGEIPDASKIRCICQRGYEYQSLTAICSACHIGTFKAVEGIGICTPCPFQTTSTGVGSSSCISSSNMSVSTGGSAISSDNLFIIIGGVVGGVVVAVVFVFVYYYCFVL